MLIGHLSECLSIVVSSVVRLLSVRPFVAR